MMRYTMGGTNLRLDATRNQKVEELQEQIPGSPTKKSLVAQAIDEYYEKFNQEMTVDEQA